MPGKFIRPMSSTEQRGGLTLIGIALPGKTINDNQQSSADIGAFWQTFMKENIAAKIPGRSGDDVYAVYYDYEGDHLLRLEAISDHRFHNPCIMVYYF